MKLNRRTIAGSILAFITALIFFWLYRVFSGGYDVDTAKKLMREFMGENELRTLATNFTYGGVFPVSEFMPKDPHNLEEGIMMWYCLDPLVQKFYLAIERAEISKLPLAPGDIQFMSDKLTKYDEPNIDVFLQTDNEIPVTPIEHLKKQTEDRMKLFTDFLMSKYPDNRLKQLPHAFFQNNKNEDTPDDPRGLLQQLCEQPGTKYIRYYFGCDSKQPSNKIRVLLFSVDERGKNILEVPDKDNKLKSALVLQRSVPPA